MSSAGVHHAGHHHSLGDPALGDRRRLGAALVLIVCFMAGEVTAGILASSLALLSDAAHMLTDALALGLALVAARLAGRPAGGNFTFGLRRSEILSAQVNGATLAVLGALILYGGVVRLVSPPAVDGATMVAVALAGIVVNLLAVRLLHPTGGSRSLNVEGAYQHVVSDLFAFMLTAAAGVLVLAAHFRRADGIAALAIAAIMLHSAYGLLRASGRVLLEASPEGLSAQEVGLTMAALPGVVEVHDLHVWELTSGFPALSAHVVVGASIDCHATRAELEQLLRDRFAITHSTLQVEHAQPPLLKIDP
ncbi:MAG TPA: cation diffusion facilitator family transporter [Solirubrobacteraceae bacterium]|nr:cation diffusion facilitator family transporter [Solirubrobacteraceae bacterium]